jgi:non-heme chloroperoxidase
MTGPAGWRRSGHGSDADDLAALTAHLDLKNAIHVGHSTGDGEVAHYLGRPGESRLAKAALISAVPLMVKTDANPNGLPKKVFNDCAGAIARAIDRTPGYGQVASGAIDSLEVWGETL